MINFLHVCVNKHLIFCTEIFSYDRISEFEIWIISKFWHLIDFESKEDEKAKMLSLITHLIFIIALQIAILLNLSIWTGRYAIIHFRHIFK